MRIKYRIFDTDNGDMRWSEWWKTTIEPNDDPVALAKIINRLNYQEITGGDLQDGEDPPGEVIRATGTEEHGIAWLEDRGHQGGTDLIIEWHRTR